MKIELFDYVLPKEKIAQHPLKNRTSSKLMVLDKKNKTIKHKTFINILDELTANDVLVLNETKVIPARLIGKKENTGGTVELLLLNNTLDVWECLTRPAKKVKIGQVISFGGGLLKAKCISKQSDGIATFKMIYEGIFLEILGLRAMIKMVMKPTPVAQRFVLPMLLAYTVHLLKKSTGSAPVWRDRKSVV